MSEAGQGFASTLKNSATELVEQLEKGDFSGAMRMIHDINAAREQSLYTEVGKLTRGLHDAIVNFQLDVLSKGGAQERASEFKDASDGLNYVIDMTEKAANRTMDMVDDCMPVAGQLGDEAEKLQASWQRLGNRELKPGEFRELYKQIDEFLDYTRSQSGSLHSGLSNILMAQEYQDLTGQVIKRVIGLVKDVEDSLVKLVSMAGVVEEAVGINSLEEISACEQEEKKDKGILAEGPAVNADKRSDVVSGQDDVDDLLSSLGF